MLNDIILWGADRVCNVAGLFGLTNPNVACVYSDSMGAGIIFWSLVGIAAVLVTSRSIVK
jgi:hypothetical protein